MLNLYFNCSFITFLLLNVMSQFSFCWCLSWYFWPWSYWKLVLGASFSVKTDDAAIMFVVVDVSDALYVRIVFSFLLYPWSDQDESLLYHCLQRDLHSHIVEQSVHFDLYCFCHLPLVLCWLYWLEGFSALEKAQWYWLDLGLQFIVVALVVEGCYHSLYK